MAPSVYRPIISLDLAPHEAIDPTTAIGSYIIDAYCLSHCLTPSRSLIGEYDAALKTTKLASWRVTASM